MLKNIIFDFGDVFINLDKQATTKAMELLHLKLDKPEAIASLNNRFEIGAISPDEFIAEMKLFFPVLDTENIVRIWNAILLDFPEYRLNFLEALAATKKYRLFLLSNTNAIHIPKVIEIMGADRYTRFKNCFERFYLSHEIKLRKPNTDCYDFVLNTNKLVAEETLFIDDTKSNTDAAAKLGIQVWNLHAGKEDVIDLNSRV